MYFYLKSKVDVDVGIFTRTSFSIIFETKRRNPLQISLIHFTLELFQLVLIVLLKKRRQRTRCVEIEMFHQKLQPVSKNGVRILVLLNIKKYFCVNKGLTSFRLEISSKYDALRLVLIKQLFANLASYNFFFGFHCLLITLLKK